MTLQYQQRISEISGTRDGDTSLFVTQLTPKIREDIVGRLLGWDTPESRRTRCPNCSKYTSPYEIAHSTIAHEFSRLFLYTPGDLWCRREDKEDSFGRELVTIWHVIDSIETDLGTALHDAELATVWPTRWHERYDPERNGMLLP